MSDSNSRQGIIEQVYLKVGKRPDAVGKLQRVNGTRYKDASCFFNIERNKMANEQLLFIRHFVIRFGITYNPY